MCNQELESFNREYGAEKHCSQYTNALIFKYFAKINDEKKIDILIVIDDECNGN